MIKEQRTEIARIISDMIKADNIIEESVSKDMKKLMSDYGTTNQEMSEARKIHHKYSISLYRNNLYIELI